MKRKWPLTLALPLIVALLAFLLAKRSGPEDKKATEPMIWVEPLFPKVFFHSGPWHCDLPNLEKPNPNSVIKKFLVPLGTKLVSLGKPVRTSVDPIESSSPGLLTNGDMSSEDGTILVLPPGPQWVQVDLGKSMRIEKVHLWHDHRRVDVYRDVVVELSQREDFSEETRVIFNADLKNVHGRGEGSDPAYIATNHGRVFDAGGWAARYVRVWGSGSYNHGFHRYAELQVYARDLD